MGTHVEMVFSRGSGGRPTVSCFWWDSRSAQACTFFLWGGRGVQRNINLAKVTEMVKCHQHQKYAFMNFIIHIALQRNSNLKPSLSNPHRLDSCNLCVSQVWPQAWSIHYSRHPGLPTPCYLDKVGMRLHRAKVRVTSHTVFRAYKRLGIHM